ncbi:hypothetical protein QYE76_058301 [Lolium multiflorum]|uniref:Retrotransposon gag domain-containing protein n=1 Tax=Lolium multiflorum TaxID=4521 RepID=A0AAD8T5E9_LOLMU|nr:hypothetical protein QYE76_058301 [Lolium multiflorum]
MNLKLPGNLKNYDGTKRPDTWIEDYYNAVTFARGTPNIACHMLQLYLVGPARIWLNDLEKNSIFCWFDLKTAFEKHFRGTYKRLATTSDLQACIQKKGETSRNFLTRWLATRNEWSEVPCTFDRQDHPTIVPKECYALVANSLSIDFVAFGDVNNFREEMITFEVVPFKSSYHVIFGRPIYHKFHARACYIYNKLKIPGPNESVLSGEELKGYRATVDPTEMHHQETDLRTENSFKAAIEIKKINFKEGDATKQVSVGANMDPK